MDKILEHLIAKIGLITSLVTAIAVLIERIYHPFSLVVKKIREINSKKNIYHYGQIGADLANEYNSSKDTITMNRILYNLAKKYTNIKKWDLKNSKEFLDAFFNNLNQDKKSQHRVAGISDNYSDMVYNILTITQFPAHFEGLRKSMLKNIHSIDHYYNLIYCLLAYAKKINKNPLELFNCIPRENYENNCLFYFLVGGFLYRKRNMPGDTGIASQLYKDGIDCYKDKTACKQCIAKCNQGSIYVELLRGLATVERLSIDYKEIQKTKDGYEKSTAAFKAALSALRWKWMPDKNKVKADVYFSYGYLSFIHFFMMLINFKVDDRFYLKNATYLFKKSDTLKSSGEKTITQSRLAIISYFLMDIPTTIAITSNYLKFFSFGKPTFKPGDFGVENNLNVIWVSYLLLLVDPDCKMFDGGALFCKNIIRHIEVVLSVNSPRAPLECHGLDLLLIDKIRAEKYPSKTVPTIASIIFESYEKYYEKHLFGKSFKELLSQELASSHNENVNIDELQKISATHVL